MRFIGTELWVRLKSCVADVHSALGASLPVVTQSEELV